jgi:hypothetical protein
MMVLFVLLNLDLVFDLDKKKTSTPLSKQVGHPLRRAVAPAGPARAPSIVVVLVLFLFFVERKKLVA